MENLSGPFSRLGICLFVVARVAAAGAVKFDEHDVVCTTRKLTTTTQEITKGAEQPGQTTMVSSKGEADRQR